MTISNISKLPLVALVTAGVFLTACTKPELILPGERLEIRTDLEESEVSTNETPERAPWFGKGRRKNQEVVVVETPDATVSTPIALAPVTNTANWTHKNSAPSHNGGHPALSGELTHLWSASIGRGNSKRNRLTSDPIVVEGNVFTLDSAASLRSFSTAGKLLWQLDLTPPSEKGGQASGGGVSYGDGVLVATTGYGEAIAVDPSSGAIKWRQKLDAAISVAPVINNGVTVVVSRANRITGLETDTGRIKWQQQGAVGDPGIFGSGTPASSGRLAVVPLSSGEVLGVSTNKGLRAWSSAVTGGRKQNVRSFVGAISGDPVLDGPTVYVANQSGRLASMDRRTGKRKWTANDGSYTPVWLAGDSVFVVTDEFKLKRLSKEDGTEIWSADLPGYKRENRRRKEAAAHFGPIVAGGRVIVASSDGLMRHYDPRSGALIRTTNLPGGAASQPAVVNGVLYILTTRGKLHAFQ